MAASKKSSRRSPIAIRGEKQVKPTQRTAKVKPVIETKEARRPMPSKALDRRRNVSPSGPASE